MKPLPFLNSCHQVQGLTKAWLVESGKEPWGGQEKLSGSKAAGKAYERKLVRSLLGQALPQGMLLLYNRWIEFWDSSGHHFAQPDILLTTPDLVICLECKLTQTPFAFDQLWYLYKPLLEKLWPARMIYLALVCQTLRVSPGPGLCYSVEDILDFPLGSETTPCLPTIHCLGDLEYVSS